MDRRVLRRVLVVTTDDHPPSERTRRLFAAMREAGIEVATLSAEQLMQRRTREPMSVIFDEVGQLETGERVIDRRAARQAWLASLRRKQGGY